MSMHHSQPQNNQNTLVIGYYPIRGKAQVARLLCEYLQIPYQDQLFQLSDWDRFKREEAKDWDFPQLPFIKDQNMILTEPLTICSYLIEKSKADQLLGIGQKDKAIVQMYLWTIDTMGSIISINCSKIPEDQRQAFKNKQWQNNVLPRMLKYEQFIRGPYWFLGYLSIIDFSIYELMNYMILLFPKIGEYLPKLRKIQQSVGQLPAIQSYQKSSKAIKEMDPSVLIKRFKNNQN